LVDECHDADAAAIPEYGVPETGCAAEPENSDRAPRPSSRRPARDSPPIWFAKHCQSLAGIGVEPFRQIQPIVGMRAVPIL